MINNQYHSNPTQRTQQNNRINKSEQLNNYKSNQSNKYKFRQARLLVVIVRQIYRNKLSGVINIMNNLEKKKYNILNIIQIIQERRIKQVLQCIKAYGRKQKIQQMKVQTNRINIKIFLIRNLDRLYNKNIKLGFYKIYSYVKLNNQDYVHLEKCFSLIILKYEYNSKRQAFRSILGSNNKKIYSKTIIISLNNILGKIYMKKINYSFKVILISTANSLYQQMYGISQSKRKQLYDYENKRSQYIANQRQNLHKLKQQIDNYTYQKNNKLGQIKRQKAIKINQLTLQIRNTQKQYQQSQRQYRRIQRQQNKCNEMLQKRIRLSQKSKGCEQKVHNMYNQLKYEQQFEKQRSFALLNIILNKQKFKQLLDQDFSRFRQQFEDYQIYMNTIQRNIICVYENVSVQSIKLSNQYQLALQQNMGLKQFIESLIFYHLLKNQSDGYLVENTKILCGFFQNFCLFLEQEQNGSTNLQIKDSFISRKSEKSFKSLKKKLSIKTSVISTRSIK